MKKTTRGSNGTSFHGTTIKTTPNELKKILGEPQYFCNVGRYKSNMCYTCETNTGKIITIYDWKYYRAVEPTELIEFHIGGHSAEDTLDARMELNTLINSSWRTDKRYSITESC
jgi:hypothetical protein